MLGSDEDAIRLDVRDAVGHIELHRPEALNAWTPDMGRALRSAVARMAEDPGVRAVLITGAGRAFCAGADVKVPRELLDDGSPDLSTRLREIYNPVIVAVRRMPKPVVAGVHGAVAGIGASLALACDLIVAAESAYLLLAFVHIAVAPDGGAIPHLMARVGPARTAELVMLGERLPAARALEWGLVNRVVSDGALAAEAEALARRLAAAPTVALASMKELMNACPPPELEAFLDTEAELQGRHGRTADYAEGLAAFAEKRPARFLGR